MKISVSHILTVLPLLSSASFAGEVNLRCVSVEGFPEPPTISIQLDESSKKISADFGGGEIVGTVLTLNESIIVWADVISSAASASANLYMIDRKTGKLLWESVVSMEFDPDAKRDFRTIANFNGISTAHEFLCSRVGV